MVSSSKVMTFAKKEEKNSTGNAAYCKDEDQAKFYIRFVHILKKKCCQETEEVLLRNFENVIDV